MPWFFGGWVAFGVVTTGGVLIAGPLFIVAAVLAAVGLVRGSTSSRVDLLGIVTGVGLFCLGVGMLQVANNATSWTLWGAALTAPSLGIYLLATRFRGGRRQHGAG
ncbi:MAG: hypothetical protein ACR2KV_14660 [Solirubrobacteraceae bacterium]